MEFVPTNLGHGVLGTSNSTIFTVPAGATAMMRSVVLVNTTASEVQVSIRVKIGAGGTARNVVPPPMRLRPYTKFDDNSVITLPALSEIEGQCDTASAVEYIISGVIAT